MFKTLNDWVLRRMDRHRGASPWVRVRVADDHIEAVDRLGTTRRLAMADIRRVVALNDGGATGSGALLLIESAGPATAVVASTCEGFEELGRALGQRLAGALAFDDWYARLVAGADDALIEIWPLK